MKSAVVRMCLGAALACCTAREGTPDDAPAGTGGIASGGAGGMATGGAAGVVSGGEGGMIAGGTGGMTGGAAGTAGATGGFAIPEQDLAAYDGPQLLSEAGLYTDVAAETLTDGVREYAPRGELWSDGATKKRWLKLPPTGQIDTSDMDDWVFPVDTKLFKEFTRDGVRVETRMVWKRAPDDWQMVAFIWNPEQTEAYAAPRGRRDASGTPHDVPDTGKCALCHNGRTDRVLGATALQLSHAGAGVTLDTLVSEGRLSAPPLAPLVLPGDAPIQDALAYLHANCGHCHNPQLENGERHISVYFWQKAEALATLQDTVTYQTLVANRSSALWVDAVLERMADRGGKQQMPPIASDDVDSEGMALVTPLIERLRQDTPALWSRAPGGTCAGSEQVFELFEQHMCRSSFCHGSASGGLFWQTPQELHDVMVGQQAVGDGCGNVAVSRVEPGFPERSLLWMKLQPGPPCGTVMPVQTGLSEAEMTAVYDWISSCTPAL